MFIFLTDETNKPPQERQFFIYGGLIVETEKIPQLHGAITNIREKYGYPSSATFKFVNKSGINPDSHRKAKTETLESLNSVGAKFAATVVLQQVLKNQDEAKYISWAMNVMTAAYHEFLRSHGSRGYGAMVVDRVDKNEVNKALRDMSNRFQAGLAMPDGYNLKVNDRIVLFGMTNNDSSHLSSCTDIVLGSFRFCVNAVTGHDANAEIARQIMPAVDTLWWRNENDPPDASPTGFRPYPKPLKKEFPGINAQYTKLRQDWLV